MNTQLVPHTIWGIIKSCDVTWCISDVEVDESSEVLDCLKMAANAPPRTKSKLCPMAVQKYSPDSRLHLVKYRDGTQFLPQ